MYRHFDTESTVEGCSPPLPKKPRSSDTECVEIEVEAGKKKEKRNFNDEWKVKYLMDHVCREEHREKVEFMVCMLCEEQLTCIKLDTIKKHHFRKHQNLESYTDARKRATTMKYAKDKQKRQESMRKTMQPSQLVKLAPYKLALIIGQRKMPLSHSSAFIEFACVADPGSEIFHAMPYSRQTVTRRMVDLAGFLKAEIAQSIQKALFWSYCLDESTDKRVTEELILYIRYIDLESACVQTKLLGLLPITGHPNADMIFQLQKSLFCMQNSQIRLGTHRDRLFWC